MKYLGFTLIIAICVSIQLQIFAQSGEPSKVFGQQISLNGSWKFNTNYTGRLSKINTEDKKWSYIEVPGEWLMQGFEVEAGKEATYFRRFSVPKDWEDKEIFIRCDAIFSNARIVINGNEIGEFNMPMIAFDIPISETLNYSGENEIAIAITAETLEDTLMSAQQYAAHQMGGILRKIYVYALPKSYMSNLAIITDLDQDNNNAELQISAKLHYFHKNKSIEVNVELLDAHSKKIIEKSNTFNLLKNTEQDININIPIIKPNKWTAESPYLYQLNITIKSPDGEQIITKKIGFRELLIVGNQLFVNGVPIKLKGVNRHEAHPLLGRSLNKELWKKDAEIFKRGNVNYIRTSHYPPSEEFISFCDSVGLYVELENPICWVGHGANAHWQNNDKANAQLYEYLKDVSVANVHFFRNHPSILIWSMANESVWTENWSKVADVYASIDPSRPASFHDQAYGGYNNYGSDKMPIANIHYPGADGPEFAKNFPRPLLYGEYAHLNTYNRGEIVADPGVRDVWGRGFKTMWNNMYQSRGCLGGAIWSGIDDVFHLPNGKVVGYGEWGPIDGWRREKPEYFHMKKTYSPVIVTQTSINTPQSDKNILLQVENRFDYTNLNECEFNWIIDEEFGKAIVHSILPHQFGYIEIETKNKDLDSKILRLSIVSPQGLKVDSYAIEIGEIPRDAFPFLNLKATKVDFSETDKHIEVFGDNFKWLFDLDKATISKVDINREEYIFNGGDLMAIALKTDACSPEFKQELPAHNAVYRLKKVEKIEVEKRQDTIVIFTSVNYLDFEGEIEYLFFKDGSLLVNYEMESKIKINPRQWGMVFEIDAKMQYLQWDRKGLWSWYPENHIGRTKGMSQAFPEITEPNLYKAPNQDWYHDFNDLGSNDFRSTKENIYWATLTNDNGIGITVLSDGSQAFRAFVNKQKNISFLIAAYSTGGGDMFFSGHYDKERKPLKVGDKIKGSAHILLNIGSSVK